MKVADNLELGAFARLRARRSRCAAHARRGLRALPAPAERAQQEAGTLSGGERQMLALGRALMAQAAAADARRAVARPRAADRARDLQHRRGAEGEPACRSCSSSRTRAPRCRSPTTATCSRPASCVLEGPSAELAANPRVAATYLGQAARRRMSLTSAVVGPRWSRRLANPHNHVLRMSFRDRPLRSSQSPPSLVADAEHLLLAPARPRPRRAVARARRDPRRTTSISPISTSSTRASRAGASRKASSSRARSTSTAASACARSSGDKQAYAYSDDISLAALDRSGAGGARDRRQGQSAVAPLGRRGDARALYSPADPVGKPRRSATRSRCSSASSASRARATRASRT